MAKFVKYFLLTAKVANGNAWKINPETAEHNMKYFVNRPLVCTDKSWFPNSAYDSYDHPYLPSNDLYAVLKHQEPYRVGTIREIQKTGDNYYAIAEILPKFASKSFPVFCSPAIFQVLAQEPENNITKWIPLHLAILDTSPAYGPSIALLKGTCSGTPEACSIQLKTAKLLMAATGINFKSDKEIENENSRGYTSPAIRGDDMDEFIRSRRNLEKAEKESRRDEEIRNTPYPSNQEIDKLNAGYKHHVTGEKIRPSKPTQKDRIKTMEAKVICPEKIASKIRDLKKESHIEEEPDNDADLERFMEQKDERFKQNIDRHVNRGGKQLSADEQPSVKINPEHGKQIADAYGSMKHDPNNPDVKKSYDALISETGKQYSDLIKGGLKIDKIKPGETPYKNSQDMHKDLSENNHLHYFPTEHGFGAGEENKDHPMMRETEFKHEDKPMLANDVFRIVHDINGHHKGGMSGFGPKGEHQAYLTHKKMYSPEAQGALASETMGQNNYVNFGPNGEHNRKDPGHTIYAPQKAGLMPDKIVNGNFHPGESKIGQLKAKLNDLVLVANGSIEEGYKEPEYGRDDEPNSPQEKIPEEFHKHAISHARKLLDNTHLSHEYSTAGAIKSMNHYISYQKMNLQHNHNFDKPVNNGELDTERKDSLENSKETAATHFGRGQEPGREDKGRRVIHELFEKFKEPQIKEVPDVEGDHKKINNMLTDLSNETHNHTINHLKSLKLASKIASMYDKSCPMNKKRVKNISAKLQLIAMTQETVPSFDEARIRYNLNKAGGRIDHSKGFTYVPKDNKVYDANNKEDALALQKRFGNGKDAIHAIARTDNHSDKLDENHKFNGKTMREHYDDIVKEGKTPTIGGFDEGGDKTTDIATVEPLSDEEARKKIKEHGQRSSGKIHLDGKFEIFS